MDGAAFIGARGIEETIEALRSCCEPRSAEALLPACLAERGRTNQRLAGVGPAVRMGSVSVVIVQIGRQSRDEVGGRVEVAAFEEATSQSAEPQFDLVEP